MWSKKSIPVGVPILQLSIFIIKKILICIGTTNSYFSLCLSTEICTCYFTWKNPMRVMPHRNGFKFARLHKTSLNRFFSSSLFRTVFKSSPQTSRSKNRRDFSASRIRFCSKRKSGDSGMIQTPMANGTQTTEPKMLDQ